MNTVEILFKHWIISAFVFGIKILERALSESDFSVTTISLWSWGCIIGPCHLKRVSFPFFPHGHEPTLKLHGTDVEVNQSSKITMPQKVIMKIKWPKTVLSTYDHYTKVKVTQSCTSLLDPSLVVYWTPSNLGGSSDIVSFHVFRLFMGFSWQEHWSGLPSPLPVDHVLSELSTMTWPSWVALHSMAHSFSELYKPLHHDKAVNHEGAKGYYEDSMTQNSA